MRCLTLREDGVFVVAAYDIVDNVRRARVATALKNFGERVQYSVFECILDERRTTAMVGEVRRLLDEEQDTFRVYRFCEGCRKAIQVVGRGVITEDRNVFIVG